GEEAFERGRLDGESAVARIARLGEDRSMMGHQSRDRLANRREISGGPIEKRVKAERVVAGDEAGVDRPYLVGERPVPRLMCRPTRRTLLEIDDAIDSIFAREDRADS